MALYEHMYCTPEINLSDYVNMLDSVSKQSYIEKLIIQKDDGGQFYCPDPYCLTSDELKDDASLWPKVKYEDIVKFLSSGPGKSYKSLSAYEYVVSGKVQRIVAYVPRNLPHFVFLLASVQPSQRCNATAFKAWVLSRDNGEIRTAHCTCMAGLGEACSHIAALLFKVQLAVTIGLTAGSTEESCKWNNRFSKKVEAFPMKKIDFGKTKWTTHDKKRRRTAVIPHREVEPLTSKELLELKKIQPDAAFFTSAVSDSSTDTASDDDEYDIPPVMKNIFRAHKIISREDLQPFFKEVEVANLELKTRSQKNKLWFDHRCGRITSSNFGELIKRKKVSFEYVSKFITVPPSINTPAIKWGKEKEHLAFESYIFTTSKNHLNFQCRRAGLHILPSDPHLGSSPDGIINCVCCGRGVLEIKCPFKHRTKNPRDISVIDKNNFINQDGSINETHAYYAQIQGQMAVTNTEYCDFVIWTSIDVLITRVRRDIIFWEHNKPILDNFFFKEVAPLLGRMTSN